MKELEQNIKQQLEDRRITPSASAWDKIQEEIKPEKKSKLWIWKSVAAVFLIGFVLAFFMLNNTQEEPKITQSIEPLIQQKEEQKLSEPEIDEPVKIETPVADNESYALLAEKPKDIIQKPLVKEPIKKVTAIHQETETVPMISKVEDNNEVQIPPQEIPKTIAKPNLSLAQNKEEVADPKQEIEAKARKTNPDKLLFYIENEKQLKKPSRIAFRNNTIQFDISEN